MLCADVTWYGVVYRPFEKLPTLAGLTDHVTPVFEAPVTLGTNCCDCPLLRVTVLGAIEMLTAACDTKEMVALAVFVGSAWLVAITVAFCATVQSGGVYNPVAEICPTGAATSM